MQRYQKISMRYDHRATTNNSVIASDMSDWGKSYVSPPSSRYGEDDASSTFTHSRQRRSRLDKDITQSQPPLMLPPLRPLSSRKNGKNVGNVRGIDPNFINGRRSAGPVGHNSTFNGYDMNSYQRGTPHYPLSRNGNESFSGRYPSYASEYLNSRNNIGLLPNKMREPKRPRSTAAEKYSDAIKKSGFGEYESGELSTTSDEKGSRRRSEESEDDDDGVLINDEDEEEEMRNYYIQSKRAQGSRSVTNTIRADPFVEGGEAYYFGVVHLDLELVGRTLKTIPPPPEYYDLQPIEKVAYVFYCAVYKKPYHNIEEFHKRFNREFYKFVCSGDSSDLALFKICKSMQDQYTLRQLEASKRAYEKAQKEALESEKLDFNQHRLESGEEHHVSISQPEEVLNYGPLKFHSGHTFATFGIGGKLVIVRPAGTIDPNNGSVFNSANILVEDVRSLLHSDEQTSKVIESVQSFKGPLIAGQTPTHSVRLYIQRQIDALRSVEKNGDVKKSEIIDALLIWQLLEIMVQQHGRVTGPDVATLLTNASEELSEKTGVVENGTTNEKSNKTEAKERFNKFLLGGHINEAVESAITDGLYADAMTLIRRLHPNDQKKIEEIETRFMQLRSIDDPFSTLVAVSSDQPPPILTSSSFDDDNNWKRHAAIVLANLNTPTAMQTIYHLGLMLSKKERNCAADFCLLVVCILAGYDPFLPLEHTEGEEKIRKHIGLIHSGSHLLNIVDGLYGSASFSFSDLHATDIYDYALRLSNHNIDSPLARSKDYQLARIDYAKKLSSYGGFATDSFRYCTEIARSLWPYFTQFDRRTLLELCDLAENLQYVAAASPAEIEWISSLRMMLGDIPSTETETGIIEKKTNTEQQQQNQETLSSEAHKWHDEHQAPIEMMKKREDEEEIKNRSHPPQSHLPPPPPPPPPPPQNVALSPISERISSEYESSTITTKVEDSQKTIGSTTSESESLPSFQEYPEQSIQQLPPSTQRREEPITPPRGIFQQNNRLEETIKSPEYSTPPASPNPPAPPSPPTMTIPKRSEEIHAKSPRSELADLWSTMPPTTQSIAPSQPVQPIQPVKPQLNHQKPELTQKTSIPTPTTKPVPTSTVDSSSNKLPDDRKMSSSRGWFGSIKEKVIKSIPSANQMILPDDSTPSIVWDPVKKKYVGAGVEEEVVAAPPPVMSAPHLTNSEGALSNRSSTNSLRNARNGGGSRYLQTSSIGGAATGSLSPPPMDMMTPPTMPPPAMNFGFIPAAVDDDSTEGFDPFSGEANPTILNDASTEK